MDLQENAWRFADLHYFLRTID